MSLTQSATLDEPAIGNSECGAAALEDDLGSQSAALGRKAAKGALIGLALGAGLWSVLIAAAIRIIGR
jgi:hypothetical protein